MSPLRARSWRPTTTPFYEPNEDLLHRAATPGVPLPSTVNGPPGLTRSQLRATHGRRPTRRTRRFTPTARWQLAAGASFLAQLVWLLVDSVRLFQRFSLTSDFGLFFQAWHLVSGSDLDPTTTVYRTGPFLTNHFELLLYPLALLKVFDANGLILLLLQDLVTVAAELVAFVWVLELCEQYWRGSDRSRHLVIGGLLVFLVVDPWIWWSSAFDFHLEAFATLFALLAARALWRHRNRPAVVWTVLTLCCGTVESVVLIGIGIGLVLAARKDQWRQGVALVVVTAAWLLGLNAAGYDNGSQLSTLYAYLVNPTPGQKVHVAQVAVGVLRHPRLALDQVKFKRTYLWHILAGPGLIGVASWIGLPVALVLLVPAVLNAQLSVVQPEAAFQVLPLYVLLPVGAALLLCWLSRRASPWPAVGLVIGLAAVLETVVMAVVWIPRAVPYFMRTPSSTASVLASVLDRTTPETEVIASNGFVGRFAGRRWVYAYERATTTMGSVPVHGRVVEFVLATRQSLGLETTPQAATTAAIDQLRSRLHAAETLHSAGVDVFLWSPPAGVHRVSLPSLGTG